tara:strand:+ start:88 stop:402 length:315 start_codon:yes stop_codon:yes gene_type:complete
VDVKNVVVKKKIVDVGVVADNIMNQSDKKDLNVVLERMEQADKDRGQIHTDIKFIKENMFNPHQGLWAETKQNSQFREDSKKWRYPIGVGLISLVIKNIWDSIV